MNERCHAQKVDGSGQCNVTWGLSRAGFCLMHDEARRDLADRARAAAGASVTTVAAPQRDGKYRVVPPSAVPRGRPPKSLDDCIRWASWLAFAAVTGALDGISVREANRSLGTLKDSLNKRDLLARIKELERKLRDYERERVA